MTVVVGVGGNGASCEPIVSGVAPLIGIFEDIAIRASLDPGYRVALIAAVTIGATAGHHQA